MALTEETVEDKIEVSVDTQQCRYAPQPCINVTAQRLAAAFHGMSCNAAQSQATLGLTQTSLAKALRCRASATPCGQTL